MLRDADALRVDVREEGELACGRAVGLMNDEGLETGEFEHSEEEKCQTPKNPFSYSTTICMCDSFSYSRISVNVSLVKDPSSYISINVFLIHIPFL